MLFNQYFPCVCMVSYPHWTRQSWTLLGCTQSTHFFGVSISLWQVIVEGIYNAEQ